MQEKKYAIYGLNRVAKDFLYIFDMLPVTCIMEDSEKLEAIGIEEGELWNGHVVKNTLAAVREKNFDQIIICDFQNEDRENRLIQLLDAGGGIRKIIYMHQIFLTA